MVLVDVQMPEMDGFQTVRQIDPARMPEIVFVTAHDRYAIEAFEINAVDYLLKPVTRARFQQALSRVKSRLQVRQSADSNRQILSLLESMAGAQKYAQRLAVRNSGKTTFVDVAEIDWISAAENYVELHVSNLCHLVHVSMNAIEKSLDSRMFVRIHRSLIVNLTRIKELQPATHGEYVVTLMDGTRLASGRLYGARLRQLATKPF